MDFDEKIGLPACQAAVIGAELASIAPVRAYGAIIPCAN